MKKKKQFREYFNFTKHINFENPTTYFYIYLVNIVFFALIYMFIFSNDFDLKNKEVMSFIIALYFSVITITTLGYGDITPNLNCSFLLIIIIFQAISGVGIIGLFLNYLSHKLSDDKAKNSSILAAHEYLENNSPIKEDFIIVNKVSNLNRLNKEFKQYKYNLQNFYLEGQFVKDLKFIDSNLYGMYIKKSTFKNIHFINVRKDSSQFIDSDLKTCSFVDCSLDKVDFKESRLLNISFDKCTLTRTKFINLHIKSPIITKSDLNGATFEESRIENANFKNSNFKNVSFKNSVLININFSGAIFENNNFEGTSLKNIYYKGKQINDVNSLR